MGFAIRYSKRSMAILRATASECEASVRRSCVVIIYRSPSILYRLPDDILTAMSARITQSVSKPRAVIVETQTTTEGEEDTAGVSMGTEAKKGEALGFEAKNDTFLHHVTRANNLDIKTLNADLEVRGRRLVFTRLEYSEASLVFSSSGLKGSIVSDQLPYWRFYGLAMSDRNRELLESLHHLAESYESKGINDVQSFAQNMQKELTILSGPLWHVFVSRDDIQAAPSSLPLFYVALDYTPLRAITTSLRIVAFQTISTPLRSTTWQKLIEVGPYVAMPFFCFFLILKSKVCKNEDQKPLSNKFQAFFVSRLVGSGHLLISFSVSFFSFIQTL